MRTARRTHSFTESVIRGMTRVATEHDAINLAQGFPNFPAPDVLKEAAAKAEPAAINQYAITRGAPRSGAHSRVPAPRLRAEGAGRRAGPGPPGGGVFSKAAGHHRLHAQQPVG